MELSPKRQSQFISLFQFFKMFPNEGVAERFFEESRWPSGVRCPRCDSKESVRTMKSRKPQPYHCKDCRKYFSVKVGTVMEASPIPLQKWLMVTYLMTVSRKGISSCQLARQIDLSQKSAYFLLSRIRMAWDTNDFMLTGSVEVDESYFGGKEKNKHLNKREYWGRGVANKTIVMGMRERERGRIKAFPVPNTGARTLQTSIKQNVTFGSNLYTDENRAYIKISGYNHKAVKHKVGQYVNDQASTNGIESFWALLKRAYMGTYHHISEKHLHRYVNEFATRNNMIGLNPIECFTQTVRMMIDKRLTYKELKA